MNLTDLGLNINLEKHLDPQYETGRVIAEHKERYIVRTAEAELEAEITGNMRFTARGREDFPAVGDWVALIVYGTDLGIIHKIYPRFSVIKRQDVGRAGEEQVIAANIDCAFVVQAADRDFNLNRLERYLTICNTSAVKSCIVLSKTDLLEESQVDEIMRKIADRIKDVPLTAISNSTRKGYEELLKLFQKGKTYCLLGSSGVGKSTLLNNLSGYGRMKTGDISKSTNKGRHVTSHRELVILDNGALLIDNPGMREVGITDHTGLEVTFDEISNLSVRCRFRDCRHTHESGCAVIEAVNSGKIDRAFYSNYLKMLREREHFEASAEELRKKDKMFGKIMKNYKKDIKKNL